MITSTIIPITEILYIGGGINNILPVMKCRENILYENNQKCQRLGDHDLLRWKQMFSQRLLIHNFFATLAISYASRLVR